MCGTVLSEAHQPVEFATVDVRGTFWGTETDHEGRFCLMLPEGGWSLRVRRIGFHPRVVAITASDTAPATAFEIRIAEAPAALQGVRVQAETVAPFALTTTAATVRQAPPLVEPDVMRVIALLPGVSQPNDWKGRVHLAGGASDEVAYRLDGHPMQEPLHLQGVTGAFSVAALDRADVLMHHLPVSAPDRLSGTIDLQSRRVRGRHEGEAVLSLLSGGVTLLHPALLSTDVLASGRVTYLDKVLELVWGDNPRGPLVDFADVLLRLGRTWDQSWRVEAVTYGTRDRISGSESRTSNDRIDFSTSEVLIGIRATRAVQGWSVSARSSLDRARVRLVDRHPERPDRDDLQQQWLSAAAESKYSGEAWRLALGLSADIRRREQLRERWYDTQTVGQTDGRQSRQAQNLAAAYTEATAEWGGRYLSTLGIRGTLHRGRVYAAPRAAVEVRLGDPVRAEFAVERRFQFDAQAGEPREWSSPQPVFFLDMPRRADVAAATTEFRSGDTSSLGQLRITGFAKRYAAQTFVVRPRFQHDGLVQWISPEFHRIPAYSIGFDAGARRALGRVLLEGSYTYQQVRQRVAGIYSPAEWDAPHAVSLFGSARLRQNWTLNTVFQARSGAAITPVEGRVFVPGAGPGTWWRTRYIHAERNSARLQAYRRLDVGVRRTWKTERADWALSLQAVNATARVNPLEYEWNAYFCQQSGRCGEPQPKRRGVPIIPSIGLEARW